MAVARKFEVTVQCDRQRDFVLGEDTSTCCAQRLMFIERTGDLQLARSVPFSSV
jgi:hypothetical protein